MCYGQRTDNPEGQGTYLIDTDKTAGLPTGFGTLCFFFVIHYKVLRCSAQIDKSRFAFA